LRFRSGQSAAGELFAVCGARTISLAVAATDETTDGLLGFAADDRRQFPSLDH
jgi:hypothetical protein